MEAEIPHIPLITDELYNAALDLSLASEICDGAKEELFNIGEAVEHPVLGALEHARNFYEVGIWGLKQIIYRRRFIEKFNSSHPLRLPNEDALYMAETIVAHKRGYYKAA